MTTREEVLSYVENNYQTKPEMTFKKFPTYCILRHKDNNKWYGLIMNVPSSSLRSQGPPLLVLLSITA